MGRRFSRHFSPLALTNAWAACADRAEQEAKGDFGEYRVRPMHQHASATFPRPVAHPPVERVQGPPGWPSPAYCAKLARRRARFADLQLAAYSLGVSYGTA